MTPDVIATYLLEFLANGAVAPHAVIAAVRRHVEREPGLASPRLHAALHDIIAALPIDSAPGELVSARGTVRSLLPVESNLASEPRLQTSLPSHDTARIPDLIYWVTPGGAAFSIRTSEGWRRLGHRLEATFLSEIIDLRGGHILGSDTKAYRASGSGRKDEIPRRVRLQVGPGWVGQLGHGNACVYFFHTPPGKLVAIHDVLAFDEIPAEIVRLYGSAPQRLIPRRRSGSEAAARPCRTP